MFLGEPWRNFKGRRSSVIKNIKEIENNGQVW